MTMIKHVGKQGERRVVVCYMTVPDEEHMCLIAYSDRLPQLLHDEVMKVLESPVGQNEKNLADALYRNIMPDGKNTLEALHRGGFLQKIQTEQIMMTPNAQNKIRLSDLNKLLKDIDAGKTAQEKMAAAQATLPTESKVESVNTSASLTSALSDTDLARQFNDQATKMRADARSLLAEAERLEKEAATLSEKAVSDVINNPAEAPQVQS